LRLTSAGERIRQESSVLDVPRVEALVGRLTPVERGLAVQGLALLARAAEEQTQREADARGNSTGHPRASEG
jgi:hypothetical protein